MIERLVAMQNNDVWYKGRNYHEWMPKEYIEALEIIFNCGTAQSAALSLQCLMRYFNEATTEVASLQGFDNMQAMAENMQELLIGILQDNGLLPEIF